jgi:small subunit ribosomal protein S16
LFKTFRNRILYYLCATFFKNFKERIMPVKMRLARHGRKRYAYYHIVVADSRAPRDGRYIERIGTYNPNTDPATIDLDFDKAFDWLTKGAQPTDTVRAILSYKGVMYKKHLMGGVKKGAFDEAEAEKRLQKWMAEKEAKIQAKIDRLAGDVAAEEQKHLEAEKKINEERAAAIAARNAELAAEAEAAVAEEEAEEVAEEATEEAAATETETPAEAEAPAAKEEAKEVAKEATKEAAATETEVTAEGEAPVAKEEAKEATKEVAATETETPAAKEEKPAEEKSSKEKGA